MTGADDPGREAWGLLFQLFRSQRREFAAMYAAFNLNPAQVHLLLNIDQELGNSMSELADALACDASYVTGIVDKLEARDLVRRTPKPQDRRVKLIALTPEGRDVSDRLREQVHRAPPFIAAMPEEDKLALRDIFRRAAATVDGSSSPSTRPGK
jgi:DNA-binding MarR family transcriptional regulator